jgi:hypothetical protein
MHSDAIARSLDLNTSFESRHKNGGRHHTMAITNSTVSPRRSVDATGRALPMTVEEIQAQAIEIARGLDALDEMGDEEEQRQTLDALIKAIDEEPLSPRRRFR